MPHSPLPFSTDEKHRQYPDHEETAEMIAARIDRDVVSEKLQKILLDSWEIVWLYYWESLFPLGKFSSGGKHSGHSRLCGGPRNEHKVDNCYFYSFPEGKKKIK